MLLFFFPVRAIWFRETGSVVLSRASLLVLKTLRRLNLVYRELREFYTRYTPVRTKQTRGATEISRFL